MPQPKGPTRSIGGPGGGTRTTGLGSWREWAAEGEHVPELRWPQNVPVYERMLFTDSQVQSLYLGWAMPILDYVFWVEPGAAVEGSSELMSYGQALADDLGLPLGEPEDGNEPPAGPGLHRFNFVEHASEALLAIAYGHYYFEQEGVIDGDLLWRLRKLGPRAPQTIAEFDVAEDGGLRSIRQNGVVVGNVGGLSLGAVPPIPVDRLVGYIWQGDARTRWTGRSMLRSLYRHWLVKDRLIRVDAINHERAGGVPWAETDERWQGQSILELAELASEFRVGEEAGSATPPGVKMHLLRAGGTDIIASLNYHDDSMARVWSAMVRQLAQGGDSANRAVGQTFAGLEDLARQAVARWFVGVFREHLIEDWWSYNVPLVNGAAQPHPTLAFKPRAVTGGGEPSEPEGGGPPPVAARSERPRREPAGAAGRSSVRPAAAGAGPRERLQAPVAALTLPERPLRREPYEHEVRAAVDFAGLDALYDEGADAVEAWLDGVMPQHVAALADAIALTKEGKPRKVVQRSAMARIASPTLGVEELRELLLPAAQAGAAAAVSEALAQGTAITLPDAEVLAARVADHAEAIATQAAHGVSLAAQRRAVQVAEGRTAAQVAENVTGYLADLKHDWERRQLNGAVQMAMNAGRFEVMGAAGPAVERFYASELLDAVTCAPCAANDGREYATLAEATNDYPSGGYLDCKGGPNCRGTVVATYQEL